MVKILYPCALVAAFVLSSCVGTNDRASRGAATTPALAQPAANSSDTRIAKALFGNVSVSTKGQPAVYGGYAKGCIAGAAELPETGPTWQAMRLSRNRNWAHPITVQYVKDLSSKAARLPGWEGLYVGDMSQPRGGPMLTGHRSHQSGLDIDIWMLPPSRLNLTETEREHLSSISMRSHRGAYTNDRWSQEHREVLKLAASDPRVERIFVFPGAKVDMCARETGDRSYLRKIRPWFGHHYHFHVRLFCPEGSPGCAAQAPVPAGDGCAAAQKWVDDILNPPPPDPNAPPRKPRKELTMSNLPAACTTVLGSR